MLSLLIKKIIAYKRSLFTKKFFTKRQYNLSNLEIKNMRFNEYVDQNGFQKDNINADNDENDYL